MQSNGNTNTNTNNGSPSSFLSTINKQALLRYGSLLLLVVQNCSAVLLMRFTQQPKPSASSPTGFEKREPFSVPIANLTIEVVKFLICATVVLSSTEEMKAVNAIADAADASSAAAAAAAADKQKLSDENITAADDDDTEGTNSAGGGDDGRGKITSSSVLQQLEYRWRTLGRIIVSRVSLQMAIPAALFTLQNNLLFVALANLEAAVFQVVYQLKLFCTAILMMMMLSKEISAVKWVALVLLFCGIVCTQLKKIPFVDSGASSSSRSNGHSKSPSTVAASSDDSDENFLLGMFAVTVCATSSAFASVYFEKVLKTQSSSLFVKNIQLAVYAFAFNALVYLMSSPSRGRGEASASAAAPSLGEDEGNKSGVFANFDAWVWLLVFVQAGGGLLVAVVIKYCDNLLKSFATAMAIVLNGIVSYAWLDFHPTIMFLTGAALVIGATFMYSL